MQKIHIVKSLGGWCATFNGIIVQRLVGEDKNAVVRNAVALARQLFGRALLFIHGADGRILEERRIEASGSKS